MCVKYKCQSIVSCAPPLAISPKYFLIDVGSAMSGKKQQQEEMVKTTRHSSIETPDLEVAAVKEKKKQDMLRKARDKFFDALKSRNNNNNNNVDGGEQQKKSRTQTTLNYLFKPCPNSSSSNRAEKNQVFSNSQANQQNGHVIKRTSSLQKQHSVGAYPIKIDDVDIDIGVVDRGRPATVCVDKLNGEGRETAALALERPRKKLSFREPEIMGYAIQINQDTFPRKSGGRKAFTPELKRSCNSLNHLNKTGSVDLDDLDLESQAMRIVRTVGQAFEVCHKLSITAPETEPLDYDEQETLTQDLVSDRLSDVTSDKPKKDLLSSEGASDKMSLPDENSLRDAATENNNNNNNSNNNKNSRPLHLDVLSIPPYNHHNSSPRKSPLTSGETYASPHSDGLLTGGSGSCSSSIPPSGNALSAHHEIQLLREQLEQQGQQTQAALAQLQLAREQLAAEQSARLEAQARTHQLLVHNRELLDHIAALVAHLQGGEKTTAQPQTSPHMTMPQQQQYPGSLVGEGGYSMDHQEQPAIDHAAVLQALGLNPQGLIENRAVTSCLPPSPLRTSYPPSNVFNFPHPQNDLSLEAQLLQRLQALCGYTPPQYSYNLNQNLPFLPNLYSQPMVNNNYTLQPPPQKKLPPSPLAMRHSYSGSPVLEKRVSPGKNDSLQNLFQAAPPQNYQNQSYHQSTQHLQVQPQQQRQSPQRNVSPNADRKPEPHFIKPLSQMGTLTTTDTDGRVRVIVPVPSGGPDEAGSLMSSLRLHDDFRSNVPSITRSTSEKVPNRSELMSQVQRTAWARHTTK